MVSPDDETSNRFLQEHSYGPASDYAALSVSAGLAAVFIYAGFEKTHDPLDFADSIAGLGILPVAFINPFALGPLLFEIACGLLLLWPPTRGVGALAIAVLCVMFFAALLSPCFEASPLTAAAASALERHRGRGCGSNLD